MVLALRNHLLGFNALNDYVTEFYQRALERLIGLSGVPIHPGTGGSGWRLNSWALQSVNGLTQ
ncbi:MAG: hypothetical protein OXM87_05465 [Truepera sp.]|nr:hypothetical protein [Truepera sp.]